MRTKPLRRAIAMIELIFAIVVIGFTLLSAPMLLTQASNSGYVAIQQEGINEATTRVNMILGWYWDESIAHANMIDNINPPIAVAGGASSLNAISSTLPRRAGTPKESYRSFRTPTGTISATSPSNFGFDYPETTQGDEDDVDDFNGTSSLTSIESATSDYIEGNSIVITTLIEYGSDSTTGDYNQSTITYNPFTAASAGSTTNIKNITVTLQSNSSASELNKTITLKAFSCNIGAPILEKRSF